MTPRARRLLASHGLVAARIVPLSGRRPAQVFRLERRDGRQCTLRQYPSAARAGHVWALLQVRAAGLPRPVLAAGRYLVLEHVEGVPLDRYLRTRPASARQEAVRELGRLLAHLHRTPIPRGLAPGPSYLHSRWLITRAVRRFTARRMLSRADAQALTTLAVPSDRRVALSHGDPSAANVVRTPDGSLRLVDEERLSLRPPAFDLARAVTHWRMPANLEADFIRSYQAGGGPARSYIEYRAFWLATALATSAAFRVVTGGTGLADIARRLRGIASSVRTEPVRDRRAPGGSSR